MGGGFPQAYKHNDKEETQGGHIINTSVLLYVDGTSGPGPADDALLALGVSTAQTSLATVTEALAFLVGCSFHSFAAAAYQKLGTASGVADNAIVAAFVYAVVITGFAVALAKFLPPPPKSA